MGLRGRLIRLPAYPIGIESLRPDRELAILAAALIDAGHFVEIMDWATVEIFERFFAARKSSPGRSRASRSRIADAMANELTAELDTLQHIDFITFKATGPSDLAVITQCAGRLRQSIPDVSLLLMAPVALVRNRTFISNQKKRSLRHLFDCIHLGTADESLCLAIGNLHEGEVSSFAHTGRPAPANRTPAVVPRLPLRPRLRYSCAR